MELPLELRREIYRYIIPKQTQREKCVEICSPFSATNIACKFGWSGEGFTSYLVNRRFCTEAIEVLFEHCTVLALGSHQEFATKIENHPDWLVLPLHSIRTLSAFCTTSLSLSPLCSKVKCLSLKLFVGKKSNLHEALVKSNSNYSPRSRELAHERAIDRRALSIFRRFDLQQLSNSRELEHLRLLFFYGPMDFDERNFQRRIRPVIKKVQEMTASTLPPSVVTKTYLNDDEIEFPE